MGLNTQDSNTPSVSSYSVWQKDILVNGTPLALCSTSFISLMKRTQCPKSFNAGAPLDKALRRARGVMETHNWNCHCDSTYFTGLRQNQSVLQICAQCVCSADPRTKGYPTGFHGSFIAVVKQTTSRFELTFTAAIPEAGQILRRGNVAAPPAAQRPLALYGAR